jgi:hypothetical protein
VPLVSVVKRRSFETVAAPSGTEVTFVSQRTSPVVRLSASTSPDAVPLDSSGVGWFKLV